MSNEAPTDALRLVPVNDDAPTNRKLAVALSNHPEVMVVERSDPSLELTERSLEEVLNELAAAPASPLPGGGPTCQLCASKIEGWICQGCGSHFYENDAGALVLNNIPAAPTGDARNGKGEG